MEAGFVGQDAASFEIRKADTDGEVPYSRMRMQSDPAIDRFAVSQRKVAMPLQRQ